MRMTYLLPSKSVAVLLGMNLSAAPPPGVLRVGVLALALFSLPGDFLGVLDGVFRRDSLSRLLPAAAADAFPNERFPNRLPAMEDEVFKRFEVFRRPRGNVVVI